MTQITEEMIEAGARVHCPFAFEDADTMPIHRAQSRDEARKEVRAILEVALAEHVVVTDQMLDVHLKATEQWVDPYEAETECGVPIECGITQEDADEINAQSRESLRVGYTAAFSRQERQSEKSADIIRDGQS